MASWTLPDTAHGGSVTVNAPDLHSAQQAAANQTGVSLQQQQGGGTFGGNTNPSLGSGGNPSTPSSPGSPTTPGTTLANTAAANQLLQQAQQAAYQAYLDARLKLDTDQQAFTQAQQAFTNTITQAQLTGQYNGSPTLAAQEQAFTQQNTQANTALGYLNMVSGLKGPADYGAYLRTMASTPQGLRDLVSSAAGQYIPGSGTTGAPTTPMTATSLLNAVNGGNPNAITLPGTPTGQPATPGAPGAATPPVASPTPTTPAPGAGAATPHGTPESPMLGTHETFGDGQWIGLRKDLYGPTNVYGQYDAKSGTIIPRSLADYLHAGTPGTVDMSREHFDEMTRPMSTAAATPAPGAAPATGTPAAPGGTAVSGNYGQYNLQAIAQQVAAAGGDVNKFNQLMGDTSNPSSLNWAIYSATGGKYANVDALGGTGGAITPMPGEGTGQPRPAGDTTIGPMPGEGGNTTKPRPDIAPAAPGMTTINAVGTDGTASSGTSPDQQYANYLQTANGLPAPNQISAASWNAYTPSQKALLLGMYNEKGWDTTDVQSLFQQSLPKYSYSGTGTIKL